MSNEELNDLLDSLTRAIAVLERYADKDHKAALAAEELSSWAADLEDRT